MKVDTGIERVLGPVTRTKVAQESGESEAILTEEAFTVPGWRIRF